MLFHLPTLKSADPVDDATTTYDKFSACNKMKLSENASTQIGKTHYQPQVIAFCTRPLHAPTSPKNKNKNTMNEQQHRKQNLRKHRQRTEYDALYTLDLAP
jgi:hypothetical protein